MKLAHTFLARFGKLRRRGCSGCALGCLLLILLLAALVCGSAYLLNPPRTAAAAPSGDRPLHVMLLLDNSNSMFEKGGVGSDPDLLRIDAARLFITYLGVDDPHLTHQAGAIFFGSQAETAVPLTPLAANAQRKQIFAQIADPVRQGWTNHLAALQLARRELGEVAGAAQPVIIMLTDGKPEWDADSGADARAAYIDELRAESAALSQMDIPVFFILLANKATDADPDITAVWEPLWRQMSAATPPGRFFMVRQAGDLPGVYHEIVVALTNSQTVGAVVDTSVPATGTTETFAVAEGLAQLTLVIGKSSSAQTITIMTPDGGQLRSTSPGVRRAGQGNDTREEVWVIEQPRAGNWSIRITGPGPITVWQDYHLAPLPPPTVTPLAPLAPRLTATSPSSPISTAVPTAIVTATRTPLTIILAPPDETTTTAAATAAPHWPWLLLSGAGLITLLGFGLHQRRRQRAVVTGTLHLLVADDAGSTPGHIELESYAQPAITLGPPPADIPLPRAEARATLTVGEPLEDTYEIILHGEPGVRINGAPIASELSLFDTAQIDFGGGVQFRYENLRLRRATRIGHWQPASARQFD